MEKHVKRIAEELTKIRKALEKSNDINIVDAETKELIASVSDKDVIIRDGYEVIETQGENND